MRTHSALCSVAAVLTLSVPIAAQDRPAAGAKPAGQMPNFTGTVVNLQATDVRGVRFRYEAGARSYWHVHDGPLVLMIEQGRGRYQLRGQPIREFGPNEPIVLPANVAHWHGASPKEGLTGVALAIGAGVKWMGPVTDEAYLASTSK